MSWQVFQYLGRKDDIELRICKWKGLTQVNAFVDGNFFQNWRGFPYNVVVFPEMCAFH